MILLLFISLELVAKVLTLKGFLFSKTVLLPSLSVLFELTSSFIDFPDKIGLHAFLDSLLKEAAELQEGRITSVNITCV